MTKVGTKKVKCAKCGAESEQLMIYSVNFMLGTKTTNERLMRHQQVCPKCNYTNFDISILTDIEEKNLGDK